MKKKIIISIVAIIIAAVLLVPMPIQYRDGGTVEYSAVLWGVTKHHSIAEKNGQTGLETGTTIRILWFDVYSDFPNEFIPE